LPDAENDMTARYEPSPSYAPEGGRIARGWDAAVATLPDRPLVLALDGPAILDWRAVLAGLERAFARRGITMRHIDMCDAFASWTRILELTTTPRLNDDPDFARLAEVSLGDLLESPPDARPAAGESVVVAGPGAALCAHDVLWYADLPKRYAEAAVVAGTARNLGQPVADGRGTTKRLFYVDWTVLDRHREAIAPDAERWIDAQEPEHPASIDGPTLRRTIARLAGRPFRTRPTFNAAPWGGHWGQRQLGLGPAARNTAIGYELIAPESGVLVGDGDNRVEVPFQLLVALCPGEILGDAVHAVFGTSFPIRFDYLDTVDGGNLSVHCHPRSTYMSQVFGWPYTQHETYYMMVGGAGGKVFLGLRSDADVEMFHRLAAAAAEHGRAFDIEQYVQTFPATPHQLFMIPAGTPHGSGEGNVVLEVSATPYLYSLRFYDWLRQDAGGNQRPVHVTHAFANLDHARRGAHVANDLVPAPRAVRSGEGWREELLGALPEVFYEVRRWVLDAGGAGHDHTGGRFHVLNVVDGDGVVIETASGDQHALHYAETMVVPAAVGAYVLHPLGARVQVVKALVR
jgi:hypothetical protein